METQTHDAAMGAAWGLEGHVVVRRRCDRLRSRRAHYEYDHFQIEAWLWEGIGWPEIARRLGRPSKRIQGAHQNWLAAGRRHHPNL